MIVVLVLWQHRFETFAKRITAIRTIIGTNACAIRSLPVCTFRFDIKALAIDITAIRTFIGTNACAIWALAIFALRFGFLRDTDIGNWNTGTITGFCTHLAIGMAIKRIPNHLIHRELNT